jgi:hypothetical protein
VKRGLERRKGSISNGRSYGEFGGFWDEHGLSEYCDKTRRVNVTHHSKRTAKHRVGKSAV